MVIYVYIYPYLSIYEHWGILILWYFLMKRICTFCLIFCSLHSLYHWKTIYQGKIFNPKRWFNPAKCVCLSTLGPKFHQFLSLLSFGFVLTTCLIVALSTIVDLFYYFSRNEYMYKRKLCFVIITNLILTSEHPLMFCMLKLSEPVPGLYHILIPREKNHQ